MARGKLIPAHIRYMRKAMAYGAVVIKAEDGLFNYYPDGHAADLSFDMTGEFTDRKHAWESCIEFLFGTGLITE